MRFFKDYSYLNDVDLIDLDYSYSYFIKDDKRNKEKNIIQIFSDISITFLKQFIKDIVSIFRDKSIKNKLILFCNSTNQFNALYPLKSKIPDSIFVNLNRLDTTRLPQSLGVFFSFLFLPHFNSILKNSSHSKLLRQGNYYFIEGMYKWWCIYLRRNRPKAIVFSNDHLIWHRVLRKAAEYNKIPTIYIQHATASPKFPMLEFNLSLLEGKDALDKYKKAIGVKTELIGMPKYDKYFTDINTNREIKNIGICTNILEENDSIRKFCYYIRSYLVDEKIYLRPHPRDVRKDFYLQLCRDYNFYYSDSNKENSFEFLKKVDLNIAGETSIHLESVLLNVYPVHFKLNNNRFDIYGYLKNGLVEHSFDNVEELVMLIKNIRNNKPNIRHRAKYYVDTVNTPFDGKSTLKAISIIDALVSESLTI